jgi:serine phosphatase RsbU (regulator of sigma subunit)
MADRTALGDEQSALLREALLARADAEAAQVRADDAREEAEEARQEVERSRSRIWLLAEAGRRMAESMDWESTLQTVVRTGVPAVADWASLTIVEGGNLRVVAVAHRDLERERIAWELIARYPPDIRALVGSAKVIRTGELDVVEDLPREARQAAAQDPEHLSLLESFDVRHLAIAPLTTPSGVIGTLTFGMGESGRRLAPEDLELITSLAARAALHIQNARLYAERSHIAEVLQASLRPRALPTINGAEVATRFMPAGEHTEVGGDFYDVFRSGDGVWTAIVGDVTGKGPEAAAVTALARHTLRTASLLEDSPGANLALLNWVLGADSNEPDFCTVLYVRLCPGEGGLDCRFANGGHPAPLILRADGRVEALDATRGPLLGAFGDARYEETTVSLAPGELILMYTDGVTEVRRRQAEFGERELAATVAACVDRSAEEVVANVLHHALELQAGQPLDDIALLAVRAREDDRSQERGP